MIYQVHLFISTTIFPSFWTIKPRHCQARGRYGPLDVAGEKFPKLFRLDNVLLPLLASKSGQGMLTPEDNMRWICANNSVNEIGRIASSSCVGATAWHCLLNANIMKIFPNRFPTLLESGRLGRSISLDFVVKYIIEELLLSWKAFFRDVPTVSITQLRAFGFSAVVYNT